MKSIFELLRIMPEALKISGRNVEIHPFFFLHRTCYFLFFGIGRGKLNHPLPKHKPSPGKKGVIEVMVVGGLSIGSIVCNRLMFLLYQSKDGYLYVSDGGWWVINR